MVPRDIILEQLEELRRVFGPFMLSPAGQGKFCIRGHLGFTVEINGDSIDDDYDIELLIPPDYPLSPPGARETSNKLPRCADWHTYPDGTLCLGSHLAVRITFSQHASLLWFVREQVVRFLSWMSYKRKYGRMPYPELSHGCSGLLENLRDLLATSDDNTVLHLLMRLATGATRGKCPCQSGKAFEDCHGSICRQIAPVQPRSFFLLDHAEILLFLSTRSKKLRLREHVAPGFVPPIEPKVGLFLSAIFPASHFPQNAIAASHTTSVLRPSMPHRCHGSITNSQQSRPKRSRRSLSPPYVARWLNTQPLVATSASGFYV